MKTGPSKELALEIGTINKAVLSLRALDHPLRQKILHFIHLNKRVFVTEIHKYFKIEQSVASDHLAILRNENLVLTEREGRFIYYSVNYFELKRLHHLLQSLIL